MKLVTISIGGNDAGFVDVVKNCVVRYRDDPNACRGQDAQVSATIDGLYDRLKSLYGRIKQQAHNARILVLGYPHLFPLNHQNDQCSVGIVSLSGPLPAADQRWLNDKAFQLDRVIQRAARDSGVASYVPVYQAFESGGHELCDSSASWVNAEIGLDEPESFHPTSEGQQALANLVDAEIKKGAQGQHFTISPEQNIAQTMTIAPGQAQATFSTSWPGSDVVMSLVSPSGRVINRDTQDADVTHQLGPTYEVYTIANPEPGQWSVNLYGANVGQDGEDVNLQMTQAPHLNQPPSAAFTTSAAGGVAPLQVQFDATASRDPDGIITGYSWDFGDGTTGAGPTPAHTYSQPGVYTPLLEVTDNDGAIGYASSAPLTVTSPAATPAPPTAAPSSTSTPPTATPIPPTATATNTTVPQATSTNTPITGATTPTHMPTSPVATPIAGAAPPVVTPVRSRARCSQVSVPLTIRLAQRSVTSGGRLTLHAYTAPRAQVSALLRVVTTKVTVIGKGKQRKRVKHTVVLYQTAFRGAADKRGQLMLVPQVTYKPAKPMQASLTVTAREVCHSATRIAQLTVQPRQFYPLTISAAPHRVVSGGILTVRISTLKNARVVATLQVTTSKVTATGVGKHRKRVRHTVVLYQTTSHGASDAHGQYIGHLRITYKPVKPVQATLMVMARAPTGTISRSIAVMISRR